MRHAETALLNQQQSGYHKVREVE